MASSSTTTSLSPLSGGTSSVSNHDLPEMVRADEIQGHVAMLAHKVANIEGKKRQ